MVDDTPSQHPKEKLLVNPGRESLTIQLLSLVMFVVWIGF